MADQTLCWGSLFFPLYRTSLSFDNIRSEHMKKIIKAGVFKAECLYYLDEVDLHHFQYIITKRDRPVAKLIPIEIEQDSFFGVMKGTVQIKGDII